MWCIFWIIFHFLFEIKKKVFNIPFLNKNNEQVFNILFLLVALFQNYDVISIQNLFKKHNLFPYINFNLIGSL